MTLATLGSDPTFYIIISSDNFDSKAITLPLSEETHLLKNISSFYKQYRVVYTEPFYKIDKKQITNSSARWHGVYK